MIPFVAECSRRSDRWRLEAIVASATVGEREFARVGGRRA
jgi:hypothetical protein